MMEREFEFERKFSGIIGGRPSDLRKKKSSRKDSILLDTTQCQDERAHTPIKQLSVGKEEEKHLCELPYYHGYLPREDIPSILRNEGDFLLRVTEIEQEHSCGKQIVISVATTVGEDQIKLRNLVVYRQQGEYRIDSTISFSSMKDLVDYYKQNSHVSKKGTVRLQHGVELQKWEYSHSDVKLGNLLGEGAFGEVREGVLIRKKTKKEVKVAVKLVF